MNSSDILTRPAPGPDLQLRYGTEPEHVIDVRFPASHEPAPLVVVLHGGFWRDAFDRTHTGPQSTALARAGYAVATPEYRRTGSDGGWPTTFDDVAAAVDTLPQLLSAAAPGRVDLARTTLVGHSAGGQLALWVVSRGTLPASSAWRTDGVPGGVTGVVSLAGVCDLHDCFARRLGNDAVTALLGGGPDDVPDRYEATDPLRLLPARVPTVLLHGTADDRVPVELSRRYADAARATGGGPVELVELPGCGHFELIDPGSSAWPHVLDAVARVSGRGME